MFGRRQRRAQFDAVERALAADAEARASLVETLCSIDTRLEQGLKEQAQVQVVTDATVQHLRATVVGTKDDLAQAVEHLATVCGMLSERIEAERLERQALVEVVMNLADSRTLEASSKSTSRVLGGNMYATPPETIDVTGDEPHRSCWSRASNGTVNDGA
jgi:hypothetical protein